MTLVWKSGLNLQSPASNDPLLDLNTQPSLDLQFATGKTLDDRVSGNNLITFSRADATTCATYVDSNGVIQTAAANVPRFDHDPVTGESLGLLIEESRTNLVTYSIPPTSSGNGWNVQTTATANAGVAPDGTTTAPLFQFTNTTSGNRVFNSVVSPGSPVIDRTVSVFVKAGTADVLSMRGVDNDSFIIINLATGQVTSNTTTSTATTVSYPNNWWRVVLTANSDRAILYTTLPLGASGSYYLWGAQVEAGSFPTSYIPTSGGTVIRAADLATIEGTNFSSWYNQSEGTVFVEANNLPYGGGLYYFGPTGAPRWWSRYQRPNGIRTQAYDGVAGSGVVDLTVPGVSNNETIPTLKHVIAIDNVAEEQVGATNGSSVLNGSWDNVSGVTALRLGHRQDLVTSGFLNGHISRLTYYPYRLADATLQEITS